MEEVKQNISYTDIANLATALKIASESHLMSLEDARFIWKTHLVKVGWKKANQPSEEVEAPIIKKTVSLKLQTKKV